MSYYPQTCNRCGDPAESLRSSWFNPQMLCFNCRKEEANHPLYEHAKRVEHAKTQVGDYRFVGIGLPNDLAHKYTQPGP